jgi:heat shock protein HslJ
MKKLILGLIIAFSLQSCSSNLQMATKKADTKWVLTEWPGKTLPTTAKATLNINSGNKISGKSFCNGFGGSAVINGNAVKFSQIIGTKMYCQEVGDAENKYLADLQNVDAGTISGGKLRLMKDGITTLIFSKAE